MHTLKFTEWTTESGRTYCADVEDMAHGSAAWWIPARMLNISLEEYILKLKNEYGAEHFKYNREKNVLLFSWSDPKKCHQFVLYINRVARQLQYQI